MKIKQRIRKVKRVKWKIILWTVVDVVWIPLYSTIFIRVPFILYILLVLKSNNKIISPSYRSTEAVQCRYRKFVVVVVLLCFLSFSMSRTTSSQHESLYTHHHGSCNKNENWMKIFQLVQFVYVYVYTDFPLNYLLASSIPIIDRPDAWYRSIVEMDSSMFTVFVYNDVRVKVYFFVFGLNWDVGRCASTHDMSGVW